MAFLDKRGRVHREIRVEPGEQPIFIFGYGSLMSPHGINNRDMKYRYDWSDLKPCRLRNYRRTLGSQWGKTNYYGILPQRNAHCNGVLFQIHSKWDYYALMVSEGANDGMIKNCVNVYIPKIVTRSIYDAMLPAKAKVIAVVLEKDKTGKGVASYQYVHFCHQAAKAWGSEFEKEFRETGGLGLEDFAKEKPYFDRLMAILGGL